MANRVGTTVEYISPPSYDQAASGPTQYSTTSAQPPPLGTPSLPPPEPSFSGPIIDIQNTSSGKSVMAMHISQVSVPLSQPEEVNGQCPRPDLAKSMTVEGVKYSNLDPGCTIDFCEKCNKKVQIVNVMIYDSNIQMCFRLS